MLGTKTKVSRMKHWVINNCKANGHHTDGKELIEFYVQPGTEHIYHIAYDEATIPKYVRNVSTGERWDR